MAPASVTSTDASKRSTRAGADIVRVVGMRLAARESGVLRALRSVKHCLWTVRGAPLPPLAKGGRVGAQRVGDAHSSAAWAVHRPHLRSENDYNTDGATRPLHAIDSPLSPQPAKST